jgi:hypothetical protein
MAGKKRMIMLEEKLKKIGILNEIKTQDLRVSLISDLEKLFTLARDMARAADNREDWIKICGYIAQVINSLAKSYDEVRFNEQMKELKELIETAKKRAGKTQAGTPVA